jgi:hypothetical protein
VGSQRFRQPSLRSHAPRASRVAICAGPRPDPGLARRAVRTPALVVARTHQRTCDRVWLLVRLTQRTDLQPSPRRRPRTDGRHPALHLRTGRGRNPRWPREPRPSD